MITFDFTNASYSDNSVFDFSETVVSGAGYALLDITGSANCESVFIHSGTGYAVLDIFANASCEFVTSSVIIFDFTDAIYSDNTEFDFTGGATQAVGYAVLDITGNANCEFIAVNIFAGYAVLEITALANCESITNLANGYALLLITGSATGEYDINVHRPLTHDSCFILETALAVSNSALSTQQNTTSQTAIVKIDYQQTVNKNITFINAVIEQSVLITNTLCDSKQSALAIYQQLMTRTDLVTLLFSELCDTKEQALALANNWLSVQDLLLFIIADYKAKIEDTGVDVYQILINDYQTIEFDNTLVFDFTDSVYSTNSEFVFANQTLIQLCERVAKGVLTTSTASSFQLAESIVKKFCSKLEQAKPLAYGKSPHLDRPRPPPTPQPPDHQTRIIPIRGVYPMQHTVSVVIYPDNIPIEINKLSLSFNVDSYAWQFSGTLANKNDLVHFDMSSSTPIQLLITINTYQWIVIVERTPNRKRFAKDEISLTGRSLSIMLGEPWDTPASFTAGADFTVQQLADQLMPYGWTCDWQMPTWLVPANTYSYTQKTKIQALKIIADNIGAVLVPARNDKIITIKPRYPVLPWYYNEVGITPDLVIPDAAIEELSEDARIQSPINGVYVHGEENGVLVWCRFNGTAGDVLAPTQSNELITDVIAARALAERVLAGKYTQPKTQSITTYLGGDFPLADVGWLVEANNERITVNGVSIDVNFPQIRQTLTFGEQTNNLYAKFINLLPNQPLLVGTVASTYGDKSIITLLDGGVVTARGTGTVGQKYYIRNGIIESAAPNLSLSEMII